ncbi:MAG TPA: hypothetical protein VFP34_02875 [Microlunatus sp.]|nr:hypothetical protein [Microlunatus sp.]
MVVAPRRTAAPATTSLPRVGRTPLRRVLSGHSGTIGWPVVVVVFLVALAARLVPVLRGGGLLGVDTYDDGVHYASALALVSGRLPYRDFLLLHPPGVVVALAPFALLGHLTYDGWGLAAGRVAWMAMGSLTAVLVALALRRAGWWAALVGGIGYAVYLPATRAERTTMLEGLTSFLLALALVLLGTSRLRNRHRWWVYAGSGALLGFATATKIWGIVVVLVVAGWVAMTAGMLLALRVLLGAVIAASVVCLPFFLAAPSSMWQMVVADQVGRPELPLGALARLAMIVGLPDEPPGNPAVVIAAVAAVGLMLLVALASGDRVAPALAIAMGAVILVSPSFYPHYPAVLAVPLALTAGTAAAAIRDWTAGWSVIVGRVGAVAALAALVVLAMPFTQLKVGARLPVASLAAVVDGRPGCVTADDPTILVDFGVFDRNIERGCPVVVDLTGYSYHLTPGVDLPRTRNVVFQDFALDYLSSGEVALPWRLRGGWGYSRTTIRVIRSWPIAGQQGTYAVRRPLIADQPIPASGR